MSLNTADKFFLCASLVNFGGLFIWIGIALYYAYAKMNFMLSYFKNSPVVAIHEFLIHTGFRGRLHVFGLMMGLMVMPGRFLRRGVVDEEDLKSFPAELRQQLIVMFWVCGGLLLVMCGLAAYAKFGRG